MRPVNLIPSESRRGGSRLAGKNPVGFVIVAVLVAVLVVVSALALFDKKTNDRQVEVDSLESQIAASQAEATSLSSFVSFKQIHDARVATIDSLAKSRFDWERVMRELSIVIPDNVWLTNLTGTATPAATVTNGAGLALRASITGPALEMVGCAKNQRTVARLIASVNDIDGVSKVLVSDSSKPTPTPDTGDSAAPSIDPSTPVTDCSIRPSYPKFELVAAFDAIAPAAAPAAVDPSAAVPASTTTDPTAAAPTTTSPATGTTTTPATGTETTGTTDDGGVAAATEQSAAEQEETAATQENVQDAAQIPSGGGN